MTAVAEDTRTSWDTRSLLDALIKHYRKPGTPRDGCILITEPQAPASQRRCDLVHIGVMSRGRGIDAHELKVSRADWLRELADPTKADAWWPYCSRWWIVAPPGTVQEGELPDGWGLMEPQARGRRFKIAAYPAVKEPKLTLGLVVELLCRADNLRLAEIEGVRNKYRSELSEQERKLRAEGVQTTLDTRTQDRLATLAALEAALGVPVNAHAWTGNTKNINDVRPAELAAALASVPGHVTAQRLLARVEAIRNQTRRDLEFAIKQLGANQ